MITSRLDAAHIMAHSLPGFAPSRPSGDAPLTLPPPIVVDARGHRCPVPSLRLRKALEKSTPGARVTLLADDPMARIDVPHMMAGLGGRMIDIRDEGGWTVFTVETGA